jgi:hypothetical protein
LRVLLRQNASNDDLCAALARIWWGRGDRYSQLRALPVPPASIELSYPWRVTLAHRAPFAGIATD